MHQGHAPSTRRNTTAVGGRAREKEREKWRKEGHHTDVETIASLDWQVLTESVFLGPRLARPESLVTAVEPSALCRLVVPFSQLLLVQPAPSPSPSPIVPGPFLWDQTNVVCTRYFYEHNTTTTTTTRLSLAPSGSSRSPDVVVFASFRLLLGTRSSKRLNGLSLSNLLTCTTR